MTLGSPVTLLLQLADLVLQVSEMYHRMCRTTAVVAVGTAAGDDIGFERAGAGHECAAVAEAVVVQMHVRKGRMLFVKELADAHWEGFAGGTAVWMYGIAE